MTMNQRKGGPAKRNDHICVGLDGFMRWQIERYREAVSENRWYMSQNQNRFVEWAEAELDFIFHGTYGCAREWRQEYCSTHCPYTESCELGRRFCGQPEVVGVFS